MNWKQRHRLRTFLKSSLWPYPLLSILLAVPVARLMMWVDYQLDSHASLTADGARVVAATLAAAVLSFIVFVFSVLLVAVQLASAQLTPRVIVRMFQDPMTKLALSIFVFTFTYTLVVLARLEEPVPFFTAMGCGYGSLSCVAVFLILIDRIGKELRPVQMLTTIAGEGREVIRNVYPAHLDTNRAEEKQEPLALGQASRVLEYRGNSGVLLAFDSKGLYRLACQAKCIIELVPQVGDFVATDDPLFRIYQGGESLADQALMHSVAFGSERTMEQDPTFAFRIIVDIAAKGLSPAINDPTTAVLALDQIHHLLRQVGRRVLDTGYVKDERDQLRLVYRTPNWEDFVSLAVTEIRHFGRESIQIARRLRLLLENLITSVPEYRAIRLREELALLHRAVERAFRDPEDKIRASTCDSQGVGASD